MKDIAERAGVSLATVSIVLSGSRRLAISDKTRRSILAIAQELEYHPNPYARNLARGSSNLFGVVISEIANPFFPEIIRSFEAAAMARGYEILLLNTEYDGERAKAAVSKMIANNVSGAAVFTSKFDRALVDQLTEKKIPTVLVQSVKAEPGVSRIEIDSGGGLTEALKHLLRLGHRKFGAITGPDDIPSARSYTATLARVAEQLSVKIGPVVSCNYRHDGGMTAVRSLFAERDFPSAILCANDLIALGAISELERAGMSVPEDVSLVGFDDLVFARLARPPLTTVAVRKDELGKLACSTLLKMRKGRASLEQSHSVVPHLIVRGSTAPPRTRTVHKKLSSDR